MEPLEMFELVKPYPEVWRGEIVFIGSVVCDTNGSELSNSVAAFVLEALFARVTERGTRRTVCEDPMLRYCADKPYDRAHHGPTRLHALVEAYQIWRDGL